MKQTLERGVAREYAQTVVNEHFHTEEILSLVDSNLRFKFHNDLQLRVLEKRGLIGDNFVTYIEMQHLSQKCEKMLSEMSDYFVKRLTDPNLQQYDIKLRKLPFDFRYVTVGDNDTTHPFLLRVKSSYTH